MFQFIDLIHFYKLNNKKPGHWNLLLKFLNMAKLILFCHNLPLTPVYQPYQIKSYVYSNIEHSNMQCLFLMMWFIYVMHDWCTYMLIKLSLEFLFPSSIQKFTWIVYIVNHTVIHEWFELIKCVGQSNFRIAYD